MDLLGSLNFASPSWDVFILLFFLVAAFLYGLSLGRDRVIVILVSIYMGLAVVNTIPFLGNLSSTVGISDFFVLRTTLFIAIFVTLFFLLSRSALLKTVASSDFPGRWWQVFVFSFLHVGLLIAVILSFLPPASVAKLSPLTQKLFSGEWALFIWVTLPILAMLIAGRKTPEEIEAMKK